MAEQTLKARKPRGPAVSWDEDEIITLATVLASDIPAAVSLWRTMAAQRWRALLDAIVVEDARREELPAAGFGFDIHRQRYTRNGRAVTPAAVAEEIENIRMRAILRAEDEMAALYEGEGTVGGWMTGLVGWLPLLGLAVTMAAIGGRHEVEQDDLDATSAGLLVSVGALNNFGGQIAAGEVTEAEAMRRAALYPDSTVTGGPGGSGYEGGRHRAHDQAGFDIERNILDPDADHCQHKSNITCPEVTALGWQPIGTLVPVGERACLWNCRCQIEYGRSADLADELEALE